MHDEEISLSVDRPRGWQTDFLKLYSTYVNNYPTALQTLHQLQQENAQFGQFIRKCEEKPECSFQDLPSLLIQPIQRIPRYEMLLQARSPSPGWSLARGTRRVVC